MTTPAVSVGVMSECGHYWTETRPEGMDLPVNGELRGCTHPDCYPGMFPVTYTEPVEMTGTGFLGGACLVDAIGQYIAWLHNLIGHDKAAVVLGVPAGDKGACLICAYAQYPTAERKQAVIDALSPEPSGGETGCG